MRVKLRHIRGYWCSYSSVAFMVSTPLSLYGPHNAVSVLSSLSLLFFAVYNPCHLPNSFTFSVYTISSASPIGPCCYLTCHIIALNLLTYISVYFLFVLSRMSNCGD